MFNKCSAQLLNAFNPFANKIQLEMADFAADAATWRSGRNIRVVFDSGLIPALYENMTSSTKPKIQTYRFAVRKKAEPRPQLTSIEIFGEIWTCDFLRYASRQTNKQTNRHTGREVTSMAVLLLSGRNVCWPRRMLSYGELW